MNDLSKRITKKVANDEKSSLSLIAKMALKDNEYVSFAIIIKEMSEVDPERIKKILGEELYDEMINSL